VAATAFGHMLSHAGANGMMALRSSRSPTAATAAGPGNWERWYREAIPLADERFTEHLIALKEEGR